MKWAEHVASVVKRRDAYRVLMGKPEGNKPHGRPRHREVDNIEADLQELI